MIADHDEIENALPAYLMAMAEPEEAEMVRAHLEGCSSCQRVARRMQRALGALPLGADEATPPARLRERILTAAADLPHASTTQVKGRRAVRLPLPKVRLWPSQTSSFRAAVAAVAIVAFALGGGLGLGLGRALTPTPSKPATAIIQYSLSGTGAMTGAQGRVYELRQEGLTLVQFTGLPQPGSGRIFELWVISKDGHPDPAAVFAPDSVGSHVVVLARSLSGLKALAVTEEVGPMGTQAPTQQPQLAGAVG
jgi:anti-sigma-K factor RskA